MKEYKIKVSFERVYTVQAEDSYSARLEAKSHAVDDLEGEGLSERLEAQEYEEPRDWDKEAEENGEAICSDIEDVIKEKVEAWKKDHVGDNYAEADDDDIAEIWDDVCQDEDIHNRAWEYSDGYFIYNSTKANQEKMDCINDLADHASGDRGLWEGKTEVDEILSIQACDALEGATMYYAEEKIKEKIAELLNN